jgi:hypothetical protein
MLKKKITHSLSCFLWLKDSPAFRCTNSEATVQPSPYLSYRLPKDFIDLSTGEDAYKLIDFLKLVRYLYISCANHLFKLVFKWAFNI